MKKIFIILMAAMVAAGSVYAADNSKKTAKSSKAYNMSIGMVAYRRTVQRHDHRPFHDH